MEGRDTSVTSQLIVSSCDGLLCRNDRREGGGGYRFNNSDRSGRYDGDRGRFDDRRYDDRSYGRHDDRSRYRDDDRDRGRRDDFDRGRFDRDRGNAELCVCRLCIQLCCTDLSALHTVQVVNNCSVTLVCHEASYVTYNKELQNYSL